MALWSPVFAQQPIAIILHKAMLCDSEEMAKEQADIFSSADVNHIQPIIIDGCGYLQHPVPAIVTPTVIYENRYAFFQLATIAIPNMPLQHGYIAWKSKPRDSDA